MAGTSLATWQVWCGLPKPLKPKPETLAKYGLSSTDWRALLFRFGNCCGICGRLPKSGRLCIDHEHVLGWKGLPPEQRKRYVRGVLCWRCNYYFARKGMTVERAKNLVDYLEEFARVKP
jgi:hypothetical protein